MTETFGLCTSGLFNQRESIKVGQVFAIDVIIDLDLSPRLKNFVWNREKFYTERDRIVCDFSISFHLIFARDM